MGSRRLADLAFAAALLVPLACASPAAAQVTKSIFCCEVGGQPICGDVLPGACYGRAYRELSPQGTVRREVQVPLTAEEAAKREEEQRRRRLLEAEALKQQRIDRALLETYRSLDDLDMRRDRALAELDRAIETLRQREADLTQRQRDLIQEAATSDVRHVRQDIAEDIRNLDGEIVAQRMVIDVKVREREAVRNRFEEDRRRYVELTRPAPRSSSPQPPRR
ncbi:hypothetical protein [Thauera sinica]|uniref:DUF4124 domain-containing protein n=1 Tax=Thauera sinica TaxID=2665146 RepID=A0ABW1ASV7_9RHOO|nr:hypothetical protein [Thauera sp. K11]ATE61416.1 hypothetical protein CCZ27_16965 [Thauera sp. K11]